MGAAEARVQSGRVILVAGIPASGKSSFGKHLVGSRNAIHVDVEEPASRAAAGFDPYWNRFVRLGDARGVTTFLGQRRTLGILDWGFPPRCLGMVQALVHAGAEPWWFDGDRNAAYSLYRAHQFKNDEGSWRTQLAAIEAEWAAISQLFNGHIVQTVTDGPTVRDAEDIAMALGV